MPSTLGRQQAPEFDGILVIALSSFGMRGRMDGYFFIRLSKGRHPTSLTASRFGYHIFDLLAKTYSNSKKIYW